VTPLEDEVGDEARAERLSASAIRRFVRYLELMRARDGETTEVLDIRVEVDGRDGGSNDTDDDGDLDAATADDPDVAEPRTETGPSAREDADAERADRRRDLVIPDDPTVLSYLLSGIVQLELPRRQALLEAATTVIRLEALIRLLDREVALLSHRLRLFSPDIGTLRGPRRS
jgi:hypothetical protein